MQGMYSGFCVCFRSLLLYFFSERIDGCRERARAFLIKKSFVQRGEMCVRWESDVTGLQWRDAYL